MAGIGLRGRHLFRLRRNEPPLPWFIFSIEFPLNGLVLGDLLRFGFLATVVVLGGFYPLKHFPPDLNGGTWYASSGTLCLITLAALSLYGFRSATAGQKALSNDLG